VSDVNFSAPETSPRRRGVLTPPARPVCAIGNYFLDMPRILNALVLGDRPTHSDLKGELHGFIPSQYTPFRWFSWWRVAYVNDGLLGYSALQSCKIRPMSQRCVLPSLSGRPDNGGSSHVTPTGLHGAVSQNAVTFLSDRLLILATGL
jgi:hypothetical protein